MAERRLSPDEAALWRKVMASVRPIGAPRTAAMPRVVATPEASQPLRPALAASSPPARRPATAAGHGATLDAGWDRKLARGLVTPDRAVDLHGHDLRSAHALLDHALGQAIANGTRVILLITGKPPARDSERPHRRGAIRAAVGDWLAASRHADRIAAVRGAHPRHGGMGALYIVLKRSRPIS